MEQNDNYLLKGNLWKGIFIYSLPLILSNLLQILFNMSDLAIIGQFSGTISLGAVGSTTMLISLFTSLLIGMGTGVDVVVAKYIGLNSKEDVEKTIHTAFVLCLVLGIIVALIGVFLADNILTLMKTQAIFMEKATNYLRCYFIGMPALAIFNFGNAIYSALGSTKKPLLFLAIGGVCNIGFNLLFVLGFNLDVIGVGIASAISQYIAATLVMIALIKDSGIIHFSFAKLCLDSNKAKQVLKVGLPSGLQFALFAIANVFIQSALNTLDEVYVEGNSSASYADSLVWETMAGFYIATSSFISQNYAVGNKKRIKDTYIITTIYSVGIAIAFGILLIIFGRNFMMIFTNDQRVIEAGYEKLFVMALSYFISGFMDNSIAASRGMQKIFYPTVIVILGSVVFRIAWIYVIFYRFNTVQSLYLLYAFSWAISAIAEISYFIYIYKKLTKSFIEK